MAVETRLIRERVKKKQSFQYPRDASTLVPGMADEDGLLGLRALHQDLLALAESRLCNIDRLWVELEARINEFTQLLDKPAKNDNNRKTLESGETLLKLMKYACDSLLTTVFHKVSSTSTRKSTL